MDTQKEAFREEAYELITELESGLLELEEAPDDIELIRRIFRAMHTIKGSGAMFGFDDIAGFTHNIETVFELVHEGKVGVTRELINLTLSACDQIKYMIDASGGGKPVDDDRSNEIIASLKDLVGVEMEVIEAREEAESEDVIDDGAVIATYRIRFRPSADIFSTGMNPILILNELRELGECDITAYLDAIPLLHDYDPESCYTYWDIVLTTRKGPNAVKDVFIFVEDNSEISIEIINEESVLDIEVKRKRLGEILVERGDVPPEKLQPLLDHQKPIGEILVEEEVVSRGKVDSALAEQQHIKKVREKQRKVAQASSVRVPLDRLDKLVDLVGELVTVQASLSRKADIQNDPELSVIAEEVENLTGGLRDNTLSIRMVRIGSTFTRFERLVRDLSRELGKDIAFTTEGGDTELDKTMIENLSDPLVHIIRNCIDHGIEAPDIREVAKKPVKGTIHLSAEHSGGHVLIRISDDGAGLDQEAICAKAVENGVISPDGELTEKEIFQLIFAPGFTTAKVASDVSGRGVGMDVVKRNLESLRGSIEVSSRKGSGTTITLKLPLTLAIIEGLLVEIDGDKFVLPLSSVEECVELTQEDVNRAHGKEILNIRSEIVPYIRLRKSFDIKGDPPLLEHVVITNVDGQRIGFVVDNVIGDYQTVIKSLGKILKDSIDVSGATILGDGTVALILDIQKLANV
ncbi:MAG: chemotaxis protein CheA [Desulfobacterales bacterium]